jgi:lysyl-tRNA synthetase class 2
MLAGIELANGFEELTDAGEQGARFSRALETRKEIEHAKNGARQRGTGEETLPKIDEKFLEALRAGLPPCAGMALGFDRLCMLLSGTAEIRQVLSFGSDEL